jgi:hypothetical protein
MSSVTTVATVCDRHIYPWQIAQNSLYLEYLWAIVLSTQALVAVRDIEAFAVAVAVAAVTVTICRASVGKTVGIMSTPLSICLRDFKVTSASLRSTHTFPRGRSTLLDVVALLAHC